MSSNREEERLLAEIQTLKAKCHKLEQDLVQMDRERVEYLQNVSHQLVAPLNAIKWHIENLTGGRLGVERAKKVLRSIYSQSTIAVHLAKNFALMSNLEGDHDLSNLKEPLQEVSLCRLLINLADDFQPLGWEKDIQIGVNDRALGATPEVLAMKPLISQVFSNIIENAVKYSDARSEIVIDGEYDEQTDSVKVNIRNKGIQLPKNTNEVFRRGYRSSDAKNKYPAGTGFGLYIAKRIVDIHNGNISVSTEYSRTVFTVTLSVGGLKGKARTRGPKNSTSG